MNSQTLEQAAKGYANKCISQITIGGLNIEKIAIGQILGNSFHQGAEWQATQMKDDCIKQQIELLEKYMGRFFDVPKEKWETIVTEMFDEVIELKSKLK